MKNILLGVFLIVSTQLTAQIKQATIQASGLTCSMCSKSIFKALNAVSFVKDVQSDIKNASFIVSFKENETIDFDALKKAVTGAGFSIASFSAIVHFSNTSIKNDAHIDIAGKTLHFLNVQAQTIDGDKKITVVDKNFVTAKEYKKFSSYTTMKCYETGVMESCCTNKKGVEEKVRIYHVTL